MARPLSHRRKGGKSPPSNTSSTTLNQGPETRRSPPERVRPVAAGRLDEVDRPGALLDDEDSQGTDLDLDRALGRAPEVGFSPLGAGLDRSLPRWKARCEGPTPTELLLIGVAGERGEYAHDDPIQAMAVKLADELAALAETIEPLGDSSGIGTALHHQAARARSLAELIGVTRLGSAA